jgi:hypothetical protein
VQKGKRGESEKEKKLPGMLVRSFPSLQGFNRKIIKGKKNCGAT